MYSFVCNHDYTTMVHCVGVSIGGGIIAAVILVVVVLVLLLCCNHSKEHDKLPTTVSTQHMIIVIIMTMLFNFIIHSRSIMLKHHLVTTDQWLHYPLLTPPSLMSQYKPVVMMRNFKNWTISDQMSVNY